MLARARTCVLHPPTPLLLLQVRHLASDAANAALYELVNIFATKDLEAYTTFVAAHRDYVASLGLDAAASHRTMRMLTLCSLAATKPVLPYDAIAAALQVRAGVALREGGGMHAVWVLHGCTDGT